MKLTANEEAVINILLYRSEPYICDIIRCWDPEYAEAVWKTLSDLYAKNHIPLKKERRRYIENYVYTRYEVNKEKIKARQGYVNNKDRK